MTVFLYIGIVLAVYLVAPFIVFSVLYCVKASEESIKLETYPVTNTLTHLLISVFLVMFFFMPGAYWSLYTAAGIYVVKLFSMCFLTKEIRYASNARSENSTENFLQSLRETKPTLSIHIRCYHIEVYYTTETYTDSNGNRRTRRERHEREVTTYTETRYVEITGWYDITPPLVLSAAYREKAAVSLELSEEIGFYENSGAIFERMKDDAYEQNRHRDQRCDVTSRRSIPGVTQYNYLCEVLPCYMSKGFIMTALLFLFDCPLCLFTRSKTPYCHLPVRKVISLLPNMSHQGNYEEACQEPVVPVDQITPPIYVDEPDKIEPPVEIFDNPQPLFVDTVNQIAPPAELAVSFAPV